MRLRWTVLIALVAITSMFGSCGSSSTQPAATPILTGLFPSSVTAGSEAFTLFISGIGFTNKPPSQVFWNGSLRTSKLNSTTNQLAVSILATDVATAGVAAIIVANPEPGGPSLATTFTIDAVHNGTPLISSLSPTSATPGSGSFTLTVTGTNFVAPIIVNGVAQSPGSTIAWNFGPLDTTFSPTGLTATVPALDIAKPGFASISVFNPTPGGSQTFSPSVNFNFMPGGAAFPMVVSVNAAGGPADGASAADRKSVV